MFPKPLESPIDIDTLDTNNVIDRLRYVGDAITLTRHKINGKVPLIGFTGAPVRSLYVRLRYVFFMFLKKKFINALCILVDFDGLYDRRRR